ncbi:MAG TPA: recombinase RecT [Gemmatimonadaceae bacterium]|nr:recombinase RecT [Gemmatimonadaceae bacterium]
MTGTALAKLRDEPSAVAMLNDAGDRITPFLPKGVDLARVILTTRLAIRKNPKILECEPESVITAVSTIQQWGLEIGTTAHLVPFNVNVGTKERKQYVSICTPIADYKGLAELVVGSGAVRHCEARCVYANEHFVIEQGLVPKLEHHPMKGVESRGALIGAYVIFRLAFGNAAFEFYPLGDIDAIRKKHSKQWKDLDECPPWYAMKTAIRQGVKLIPKNPRLAAALQVIAQDEQLEEEGEFEIVGPASGAESERSAGASPAAASHPAEATHPSPAAPPAVPNATKVVTPTSITDEDIAWASKVKLLGKSDKWGGHGGEAMGELPTSLLEQVREFFAKKRAEKGEPDERIDTQIRAAAIILADRERQQTRLFDGPSDADDEQALPSALKDPDDDGLPF